MFWAGFALVVLSVGAPAQQNDCKTAIGIPCYTLHGTLTQWDARSLNPHKVERLREDSVRAVRKDGSNVSTRKALFEDLWGRSLGTQEASQMYLAPENAVVQISQTKRQISRREPMIWHDLPYRRSEDNDSTCQTGVRHFGTDLKLQGTSTVVGIPVVKWTRTLSNGTEDHYLAPSLDCTELKGEKVIRGALWIPLFMQHWEVTALELGEPSAGLFTLPIGYTQIEDPHRARLEQFLQLNGGRGRLPQKR